MTKLSTDTITMSLQALRKEIRRLEDMLASETLYDVNKFQQQHQAYISAEKELSEYAGNGGYE